MNKEEKTHLSDQKNEKGNRIKMKGLVRSILKNGMLYTVLPLLLLYWGRFYITSDASQFPKALIYSLIIFPPLGIIIGYSFWLMKNLKKT